MCIGVMPHEFLPQGRTINKEYCLEVIRRLCKAIRQKRTELWKSQSWILLEFLTTKQNRNHASITVFTGLGPC